VSPAECAALCNVQGPLSCYATIYDGQEAIACSTCVTGRRPTRLHGLAARDGSAGDFLARCSWLEAAAVHAFRRLARELDHHGAPRRLGRRARTAARDEIRHARETASLARALGGAPRRPGRRALPVRGLEAVARENAVEGCVRETYGALVAMWQAERATDPRVARTLGRIAGDEARHAAIGWQVAEWAEKHLSPAARDRVRKARHDALAALRAEIAAEPPRDVVDRVGVPTAAQAACLLDALERHVMAA
jgi:rubrerythrin